MIYEFIVQGIVYQNIVWEVLLGIRLLGSTFWCGLSNHQAAAAQIPLVEKNIVERPPLLGALPLSLPVSDAVGDRQRLNIPKKGDPEKGESGKRKSLLGDSEVAQR